MSEERPANRQLVSIMMMMIPTMVGFCHGGNLPAGDDDDGDDDDFIMSGQNYEAKYGRYRSTAPPGG